LTGQRLKTLELVGIDKSFQDVHANRDVNLRIGSGDILGLLGENGAGKTTLMNILYGMYQPDAGEIRLNGNPVRIRTPKDSMALGIGMVHQHFMLVQNHTVAENVALSGSERGFIFPAKKIRRKLEDFSSKYGLTVDPDKYIWQLSAGEQQRVEIVKAMLKEADLLILDEPTSVLTPQETGELFSVLRRMSEEGHAVILISHKLEEIIQICDRAVVLRKGSVVGETDIASVNKRDLARMMVGREVIFNFEKEELAPGKPVLDIRELSVRNDRGMEAVKKMSFTVHRHEIFGIAGVSGNGQKELIEAITGLRKIDSGEVIVGDRDISNGNARSASNFGITHVPEERMRYGIVPNLFVVDNSVLKRHHRHPFAKSIFLNYRNIKDHAQNLVGEFNIDTPSINTAVKNLSGGNIQKLILGREISSQHELLVAAHPTYGLDVGATEFIRNHLLDRRKAGGGVLLVSEDLEEIYELADRIAVVFDGEIMGIKRPEDLPIEEVGLMMAGSLRV